MSKKKKKTKWNDLTELIFQLGGEPSKITTIQDAYDFVMGVWEQNRRNGFYSACCHFFKGEIVDLAHLKNDDTWQDKAEDLIKAFKKKHKMS